MKRLLAAIIVAAAIVPVAVQAGEPASQACDSVWVTYGQPLNCTPATGQPFFVRYLPSNWTLAQAHTYCASLGGDAVHTRYGGTANVCSNVDPQLLPGGAPSTTSPSTSTTSTIPVTTSTVPTSTTTSTSTSPSTSVASTVPAPTTTLPPPPPGAFPTPESTGPRSCPRTTVNGSMATTANGQVISCVTINGNLTIRHSNVVVRDVLVNGVARYMIQVSSLNGVCPTNVRVEYTEVNAANVAADLIPIYATCGATFDHIQVDGGGAGVRLVSNSTVTESYVHTGRRLGDQHRTALSMHGGTNNRVIHNTLFCERPAGVTSGSGGCSAALSIYGDFALPNGFLAQDNLLIAAGGFCMYGGVGSPESNQFPDGANIDIIDNHFSTRYNAQCGIYGALAAYTVGIRGNECRGNVWAESGRPMTERGCS